MTEETVVNRHLLLVVPLVAVLGVSCAENTAPRAVVDGETLEGVAFPSPAQGAAFLGIPYAQAPVGELRWRPPQPRPPAPEVRSARAFGASCPQRASVLKGFVGEIYAAFGRHDVPFPLRETSEDCLFLNVWTSNLLRQAPPQPVMVWIHGGGNILGDGGGGWTDGTARASRGVVVVSMNYRLGLLGFLAHPQLTAESPNRSSGNYGLLDQLEALRWVQRNIEAFGGDPQRVTVIGESAGGADITHLVASPLSEGLFHRAIVQSGPAMGGLPSLRAAEREGVAAMAALGLDSTADLAVYRALPAEQLVNALKQLIVGPVVDGWFLPDVTGRRFEQGRARKVPLVIGSNALEGATLRGLFPSFDRTVAGYRAWLKSTFDRAAPGLEALYAAPDDAAVEPALTRLFTDLYFTCPSRFAARAMAATGTPVWQYYFTRVNPNAPQLGAYHAMEIPYVFGNRDANIPMNDVDERLSSAMMSYWIRFAATGNPNTGDLPDWPAYDDADRHLELGDSIRAGQNLKADVCQLTDVWTRATWASSTSLDGQR